jgi:beta-lactamase regulating signal transducer with metallopeptidase domain
VIAWAIEALAASTLLMLLVLVVRGPVRRSFGAEVAYALWLLPAMRLFLPPLPLGWNWSQRLLPALGKVAEKHVIFGIMNPAGAPHAVIEKAVMTASIRTASGPVEMALVPPIETPDGAPVALVVLGIWLIGALAFLIYHFARHSAFCARLLQQAQRVSVAGVDRVRVIETPAAAGPLAFGIWRKYVVFPRDFGARYDEEERALALAHELGHHARGDLIANWAALSVLALHWFNPVAWHAFRAFRTDQEMACDARVLAGRDPAFRHVYGRAIVKAAHGGAVSAACHLHTINDLKGRLKMLSMGPKSRLRVLGGVTSVAALTLAGLGLTASGTEAATRLSAGVGQRMGVDIARLDVANLTSAGLRAAGMKAVVAPVPPTPGVAVAPAAPVAVAVPPSQAAETAPAPPEAPTPPDVAAPPAPAVKGTRVERNIQIITTDDGVGDPKVTKRVRIIRRDKDGKVLSEDERGFPDIPQVSSGRCPAGGDGKQTVVHSVKDGKQIIVICTDRIEKMASEAAKLAANSKDIERHALESALAGLRSARSSVDSAEGRKGIDEAIAEIEQDMAKID